MTLSDLILLAGKKGYMFDEKKTFHNGHLYVFFTTFDGHSRSEVEFDTQADAERYFKDAERDAE